MDARAEEGMAPASPELPDGIEEHLAEQNDAALGHGLLSSLVNALLRLLSRLIC
jgi:hypothetical protein